ncbi:hypothetical protein JCM10207_008278 [Rhodosporidiobolus poonsookiae]
MPPSIVVHWLEDSRAQRILWLLEELGLEYEVKKYQRNPKTNLAGPELKAVHPLGKSPVVVITDGAHSTTLAESGAIVEFLIERYGEGKLAVPPTTANIQDRTDYLYWLHSAEGSFMFPLMLAMIFTKMPTQAPWFVRPVVSGISSGALGTAIKPRLRDQFGFFNAALEGKDFLVAGQLTGADIMMSFIAEALEMAPVDIADYPNITRWFDAMKKRETYVKAEERGGKNDMGRFLR